MSNDNINSILQEKTDANDFKEILQRRGVLDNPNAAATFIVSLGDSVALGIVRTAAALVKNDPNKAVAFARTLANEETSVTEASVETSENSRQVSSNTTVR